MIGNPAAFSANALPISFGPACAGCHSGNYAPSKHQGVGTAPNDVAYPFTSATTEAFSEPVVGCSTCHYNKTTAHGIIADPKKVAELTNADLCGQCHARYSTSKTSYALLAPIGEDLTSPYAPEYAVGYDPFTTLLNAALDVPTPASPQRNTFWSGGQSAQAHGDGAVQYEEWAESVGDTTRFTHANALTVIKALIPATVIDGGGCLECHSADYRILKETGQTPPKAANAKYAITCVVCHDPHSKSTQASVWNADRNPQLSKPAPDLCEQCHNAEIPAGQSATAGSEVHHPMKEMMDGTSAIDVTGSPSIHHGKCISCHMVPTGYGYDGAAGTSGNHVFAIVSPASADGQTTQTATGPQKMPYSSCSGPHPLGSCHGTASDPLATARQAVLTSTQAAIHSLYDQVTTELAAAATRLGYTGADSEAKIAAANTAINKIKPMSSWTASQLSFQKSFTNRAFVATEGSWGIHNPSYATAVINKALEQAQAVKAMYKITLKASKTSVKRGKTVKFTGKTDPSYSGKIVLQLKKSNWSLFGSSTAKNGSFAFNIKFKKKGTFIVRAFIAPSASFDGGASNSVTIKVK